jgi:VWFA-related protein
MRTFLCSTSIILLLLISVPGFAQAWIRSVEIPCVVTDKSGRYVADLGEQDFIVRDNGKRQKITGVKFRLQEPLSVALVLDRSRSVAPSFELMKSTSAVFLKACLVAFDSHVYLLQNWTDDITRFPQTLNLLPAAGGTSLFDAIYKTSRDQFDDDKDNRIRIILLVTDGEDTDSRATFKQMADMVSQSGAAIYVLGIPAKNSLNPRELHGKNVLTELAEMTGGSIFYPKGEDNKIGDRFAEIENELHHEYVVTFTNYDEPDGKFHHLDVQTPRQGLRAYSRKEGYFASR